WLSGSSRKSQILVIDDSLSMGYQDGGRSAFERAQELGASIASGTKQQDHFTLLVASQPKNPLLHEVELTDSTEATKLIRGLRVADSFVSGDTRFNTLQQRV